MCKLWQNYLKAKRTDIGGATIDSQFYICLFPGELCFFFCFTCNRSIDLDRWTETNLFIETAFCFTSAVPVDASTESGLILVLPAIGLGLVLACSPLHPHPPPSSEQVVHPREFSDSGGLRMCAIGKNWAKHQIRTRYWIPTSSL